MELGYWIAFLLTLYVTANAVLGGYILLMEGVNHAKERQEIRRWQKDQKARTKKRIAEKADRRSGQGD